MLLFVSLDCACLKPEVLEKNVEQGQVQEISHKHCATIYLDVPASSRLLKAETRVRPISVHMGFVAEKGVLRKGFPPRPSAFSVDSYLLLYRMVERQRVRYWPQFHRNIFLPHRNKKK
jgi:hypothetical protein